MGVWIFLFWVPCFNTGSPLLARGIQDVFPCLGIHLGITPACAGNTRLPLNVCIFGRDHPRLRGEYVRDENAGQEL